MLDDEAKSQILLMSSLLVVPNAEKALRALKDFRPIHVADVLDEIRALSLDPDA